jgi:ubiquinone/menaquinone biosynthesis C-methylase UbiE
MSTKAAEAKIQKGYKGMAMEGIIATWYAGNTRSRMEEQRQLAARINERVAQGGRVLEVSPGPGYLSVALAKMGKVQVSALDISKSFVEIVRKNAAEAGVTVDARLGDAAAIPFEDNTFDFIVDVAAFKNFTRPVTAIDEFWRVLRPSGTALIADLRGDTTMQDINREVDRMHLDAINAWLTRMAFRGMLLKNAYTRDAMKAMVAQTRFKTCDVTSDTIGMEVTLTK